MFKFASIFSVFFLSFTAYYVSACEDSSEESSSDENSPKEFDSICDEFRHNFDSFSGLVFASSIPGKLYQENYEISPVKLIYNQEGYKFKDLITYSSKHLFKEIKLGTPIKLNEGAPIGYNIFLPEAPKAVLVQIYPGHGTFHKDRGYKPEDIGKFERFLLQEGIAVITLNLPDLLKLNTVQLKMPQDLHKEINECINLFFTLLKHDATFLHADLSVIQGKKIFLYGTSFGGMFTVRHSELYPKTYDGYISNEGCLSCRVISDNPFSSFRTEVGTLESQWLSPMTEYYEDEYSAVDPKIAAIQDPILIFQNLDDNNVLPETMHRWYKRTVISNKSKLMQLVVSEIGSLNHNDKGHFHPEDEIGFLRYMKALLWFLLKGPFQPSSVNDFVAFETAAFAKANSRTLPLPVEEVFLNTAYLIQKNINTATSSDHHHIDDMRWNSFLLPLLYALNYSDEQHHNKDKSLQVKSYLNEVGIKQNHIESGLKHILPNFLLYVRCKEKIPFLKEIDVERVSTIPELHELYRKHLINLDETNKFSLYYNSRAMFAFYYANLDSLSKGLISEFDYKNLENKWERSVFSIAR